VRAEVISLRRGSSLPAVSACREEITTAPTDLISEAVPGPGGARPGCLR
jgi:hypothetical protein